MSEVVINNRYGGYSLSYKAMKWLSEHGLKEAEEILSERIAYINNKTHPIRRRHTLNDSIEDELFYTNFPRHHPLLVQCVKELGVEAGGMHANLTVVKFEGNLYRIDEYDGLESIETPDSLYWFNSLEY